MVRLGILLVLLCLTAWEWYAGTRKYVYWLVMTGLFAFFALRYGQGTDYLTYLSIYANVPPLHTFPLHSAYQYNYIEIGFFYLMSFFRMLGVHYVLFVAIITAFSLYCIHRFIRRFCPLPVFALTFFFAVYSLTYMESGIRELISAAIAFGFIFIDWADGRRVRALIGIAIAALIHTSALVLLLVPILFWNPRPMYLVEWKPKKTAIVLGLLVAATAVINIVDMTPIIQLLPSSIEYRVMYYYTENSQFSLMALANRSLFMAVVLVLAWRCREELSPREKLLFNLYCVGYGLYLMLVSFDLIASRINLYFRIIDFCLIPLLFHRNRDLIKRTVVAFPVMLALISFLYVKDITATMGYAQYYSNNPLEYPYVTVFNADDIFDNKFVNAKNASAMNAYQTGGLSWDEYYQTLQRKPSVRSPIVPY